MVLATYCFENTEDNDIAMCHMLFSLPHDTPALPIAMWHCHMPLPCSALTATAMWQKKVTTPPCNGAPDHENSVLLHFSKLFTLKTYVNLLLFCL